MLLKGLPYVYSRLLYNVSLYIVFPTMEDCIAILPAEDYIVIHSTEDCFMIPAVGSSMLLNV